MPPSRKAIRLFGAPLQAELIDRPNRYRVRARLNGRVVHAFMPNPGRMGELLLPGARLFLTEAPPRPAGAPRRKTKYNAVAVMRSGHPRLLDTHANNTVAEQLIRRRAIPAFREARVVAREVTRGRSRFDLMLKDGRGEYLVEVKSCNLVERGVALFPDAPTTRGKRHVEELAAIAAGGGVENRAAVLFLVHDPETRYLLPHIHADLDFSTTLCDVERRFPGAAAGEHDQFRLVAAAVTMNDDLSIEPEVREVPIPLHQLEGELADCGSYLILMRLPRLRRLVIGALGAILFPPGWYIYVGSARRGLYQRVARHRRRRKRLRRHIDYLRESAGFEDSFEIRSSRWDECRLAEEVRRQANSEIKRFGSSDCSCASHLFHFDDDPRRTRAFHDLLAMFRHAIGEPLPRS